MFVSIRRLLFVSVPVFAAVMSVSMCSGEHSIGCFSESLTGLSDLNKQVLILDININVNKDKILNLLLS